MIYFPDANLCDGAAELESKGFLDVENAPPWDTWVGLGVDAVNSRIGGYETYLVAWVPPQFIEYVSAGIRVNPEKCIAWLDDVAVGARAELKHLIP